MKKELILIGLICISVPIMSSDTLVGVLRSQDTENTMIDSRLFEGDSITSLVIAPEFSNSKFGGYLSVGGTFGRSEEKIEKDEKNKDFKNDMSYRVFNLGLRYSPISNVTFLGGLGYGQSEGKYYYNIRYDNRNRIEFDTSRTEKDRGVNYNLGLNFSYKNWGIITMYDSYPKVFSVGISYNYKSVKPRPKQRIQQKQQIQQKKSSGVGTILGVAAGLIMVNGIKQGLKNVEEHEKAVNALPREDYRRYKACVRRCNGERICYRACNDRWVY